MSLNVTINYDILDIDGHLDCELIFIIDSGFTAKIFITKPFIYSFNDWRKLATVKSSLSFDYKDFISLENNGEELVIVVREDFDIERLKIKIPINFIAPKLLETLRIIEQNGCKFASSSLNTDLNDKMELTQELSDEMINEPVIEKEFIVSPYKHLQNISTQMFISSEDKYLVIQQSGILFAIAKDIKNDGNVEKLSNDDIDKVIKMGLIYDLDFITDNFSFIFGKSEE